MKNDTKIRRLRYSSATNLSMLSGNPAHGFASTWAACFYRANAVYSVIPKNGCSSLRLTLAIENGCIDGPEQANWIHQNNDTFQATLRDLVTADYSFVILRCPFRRLASVYLDKIVGREFGVWRLGASTDYKYAPQQLTFRNFVEIICQPNGRRADEHWRPQTDFLVYQNYDDWFALEQMNHATEVLRRKLSIELQDARGITQHGTDKYELLDDRCYADVSPVEIFQMQQQGKSPSHHALYDAALMEIAAKLYMDDLKLYVSKFGVDNLLFKSPKMASWAA